MHSYGRRQLPQRSARREIGVQQVPGMNHQAGRPWIERLSRIGILAKAVIYLGWGSRPTAASR